MVNLPLTLKRPESDDDKAWLLARLDLLRAMINAGEPITTYDSREMGVLSGETCQLSTLVFAVPEEVRTTYWRAQREAC